MTEPKIIYLTSWYNEKNNERESELLKCIDNIRMLGEVDELLLLSEFSFDVTTMWKCPVKCVSIGRRPTYNDFFKLANKVAKQGDIVIIANTDIYPEIGLRENLKSMQPNDCYALSRYDEMPNGDKVFFDRWDSQDVWIFKAPIKNIDADFNLGKAACDNAILDRAYKQSYNVQNPSKSIKFNHLHNSGIRNYNPDIKVPKPYLLITPHFLGEVPVLHFISNL